MSTRGARLQGVLNAGIKDVSDMNAATREMFAGIEKPKIPLIVDRIPSLHETVWKKCRENARRFHLHTIPNGIDSSLKVISLQVVKTKYPVDLTPEKAKEEGVEMKEWMRGLLSGDAEYMGISLWPLVVTLIVTRYYEGTNEDVVLDTFKEEIMKDLEAKCTSKKVWEALEVALLRGPSVVK